MTPMACLVGPDQPLVQHPLQQREIAVAIAAEPGAEVAGAQLLEHLSLLRHILLVQKGELPDADLLSRAPRRVAQQQQQEAEQAVAGGVGSHGGSLRVGPLVSHRRHFNPQVVILRPAWIMAVFPGQAGTPPAPE